MRYQGRFVVSHPPTSVFSFVSDVRNEKLWNPRMRSIRKVTDGPVAAGTVFEGEYDRPMGNLRITVTRCEAPALVCFACDGSNLGFDVQIEVAPEDTGSAVALSMDVRPRGLFRLLLPLMALPFRRQNDAALASMREGIERAAC